MNKKSKSKSKLNLEINKVFNDLFKWEGKEEILTTIDLNNFISDFKDQAEQIICPICLLVPLNPIQCKKCDIVLCNKCMNKNKNCPNCREIFDKKLDRSLLKMIEQMKLNCPNSPCSLKIKVCEYKTHLLNCEYSDYSCLICKKKIKQSKQLCREHGYECGYSDVNCIYCSKNIKLYKKKEHETLCGETEIECNLCKLKIKNKNLINHKNNECEMRIIKCPNCLYELTYKVFKMHSLDKCKDNQILYWKSLYLEEKKKNEEKEKDEKKEKVEIQQEEKNLRKNIRAESPKINRDFSFDFTNIYTNRNSVPKTQNKLLYKSNSKQELLQYNNYLNTSPNTYRKIDNKAKLFNQHSLEIIEENYYINIKSSILKQEDKIFLFKYFKDEQLRFKLLYSMSKDGGAKIFHQKCDKKGSTLIIFKIQEKDIRFGGYTSVSWDDKSGEKYDENAFIFSLNNKKTFKTTIPEKSIYCDSDYGPFFGGNKKAVNAELWVGGTNNGGLYNYNVYQDKKKECTQGLEDFILEEIEVFQVKKNYQ